MSSDSTTKARQKRKQELVYILGEKCAYCGYNKCIGALEFHHLDKATKKYGIAAGGLCHSFEEDIEEVKKCILVCSNCHKELEYGILPTITESSFNYDRYNEVKKTKLPQEKKTCKSCGVEISPTAEYCLDCRGLQHRKCDHPSREELKNLIHTTSFVELGHLFGVSDNAVRKWCIQYGLPSKKTVIKSYSKEEWDKI